MPRKKSPESPSSPAKARDLLDAYVDAHDLDVTVADGFDEALVGIATQHTTHLAVYDREKCIKLLIQRDKMTREDAEEYFSYNVEGAFVGKGTPVFLTPLKDLRV